LYKINISVVGAGYAVLPHILAKILLLKLIRFGQIELNLGKSTAKFGKNDQVWA